MASFLIQDVRHTSATVLPDDFVDYFMPRANGEFVKIYIYLLRIAHSGDARPSLSSMADVFSCPEKDVLRALRYWEKAGLVSLKFDSAKELTEVRLLQPTTFQETQKIIVPETEEGKAASVTGMEKQDAAPQKAEISSSRMRELCKDEEAKQILFIAEQYLGHPLSSTETRRLLYFYDELHFSADLIDYLVEYCVSKEQRSMNYIEKVGLAWHQDGVTTVKQAKARTSSFKSTYFAIFKAFGIRNRNPIPNEQADMDRWLSDYGFSLEFIQEAAARTVEATGKASFNYAEKILAGWHENKVTSFDDIRKLDEAHKNSGQKEAGAAKGARKKSAGTGKSGLHNFKERDSSVYDQIQKDLMRQQIGKTGQ